MQILAMLALALATTPRFAHADAPTSFLVVSDIDDTIKITNVLDKDHAVENGIFGQRTFLGMSELYQGLIAKAKSLAEAKQPLNPAIVYMSGSPPVLEKDIRDMLVEDHKFPDGKFLLRSWIGQDIYDFKSAGFKQLDHDSSVPFLALGDDTERDPEVLRDFAKAHPASKVAALYIHRVTGRQIPKEVTPFYTAYEVALAELDAGRLAIKDVTRVGQAILGGNLDELFPSFTVCPEDLTFAKPRSLAANLVLSSLSRKLAARISNYCGQRNGHPIYNKPTPAMKSFIDEETDKMRSRVLESVDEL